MTEQELQLAFDSFLIQQLQLKLIGGLYLDSGTEDLYRIPYTFFGLGVQYLAPSFIELRIFFIHSANNENPFGTEIIDHCEYPFFIAEAGMPACCENVPMAQQSAQTLVQSLTSQKILITTKEFDSLLSDSTPSPQPAL